MDGAHDDRLPGASAAGRAPPPGRPTPPRGTIPRRVGPYTLERALGEGSQASVFLARHDALDRPVALKVLSAHRAADPEYTERFHQEARLAARVAHRNVVTVFDSGCDQGLHWLAMEHVDGTSVGELLRVRGTLPEAQALDIAAAVAEGLAAAQAQGILHRDIKPGNILLTADGVAKLADLGLAKDDHSDQSHTKTGVTVGTPHYMSPEQALGRRDLDGRTDIYSLGITLFQMVTGKIPLASESTVETLMRHTREDVPPPSSVDPNVSPALDAIVGHMTARNRERRYEGPARLIEDIAAVREGRRPVHATAAARPGWARGAAGRRTGADRPARAGLPPFAVGVTMVALAAVGFAAGSLLLGSGDERSGQMAASAPPQAPSPRPAPAPAPMPAPAPAPAPDPAPTRPVEGGPLSLAEVEAVARDVERLLGAGQGREAIVRYRTLGIGGDIERLARPLSASPGTAITMWTMAAVDCAARADQVAQSRATERLRIAYNGNPTAARVDIQKLVREAGIVSYARTAAMLDRDPRLSAAATTDPVVARYLEPEALEAMRALARARLLIPDLVAQRSEADLLWQPSEVRARYERAVEPVRQGLGAMPADLAGRVSEILRLLEGDLADLDDGLIRLRGIDGATEAALHAAPDTAWWHRDELGGLVNSGDRDGGERLGRGEIYLEIPSLRRYARIELDLVGVPEPVFGAQVMDGERIVASAVFSPSSINAPRLTAGPETIGPTLRRMFEAAQQQPATTRVGMVVRIENETDGGLPAVYANGQRVASPEAPAEGSGRGLGYRIFCPPRLTSIHQVRMFLAPR